MGFCHSGICESYIFWQLQVFDAAMDIFWNYSSGGRKLIGLGFSLTVA
jgi:hypothetical protein